MEDVEEEEEVGVEYEEDAIEAEEGEVVDGYHQKGMAYP